MSTSSFVVSIGVAVVATRDVRAVLEVGLPVGLRLQVDELLADRGPVGDQRLGVRGDVVVVLLDARATTSTPLSVSFMSLTRPTVTPR